MKIMKINEIVFVSSLVTLTTVLGILALQMYVLMLLD